MQERCHTICQKQGKRRIFKCEIHHNDTGESCFKNFPRRRDAKYAVHLIQRHISPCAFHEGVQERRYSSAVLILSLGNKCKWIISFMTMPMYLWAKLFGVHWPEGLAGPTADGNLLENRIISCPARIKSCQLSWYSIQILKHTQWYFFSKQFDTKDLGTIYS